MPLGGFKQMHARLIEPTLNPADGFLKREGTLKNPGIGTDSKKGAQDRPAEAHGRIARKLGIPPFLCRFVKGAGLVLGVQ